MGPETVRNPHGVMPTIMDVSGGTSRRTLMRRIGVILLLVAFTAAACGDPLEGIGDLSRRVVHGDDTSTTAATVPDGGPALNLTGVTDAIWVNDGLDAGVDVLGPEALLAAVWARSDGSTAFIQASRTEIAAALAGVEFPRLIPGAAVWISSQLVYDLETATLDPVTSAAFGMWTVEPYTAPRNEAQLAVLRVGTDTSGDPAGEIFSFRVAGGRELTWTEGGFAYQLFCRTGVTEEACFAMAESTTLLALLSTIPSAGASGG